MVESEAKLQGLRVLGKLVIHRLAAEDEENRDYKAASELIAWSKQSVVGALRAANAKEEKHVHAVALLCATVAVELITCGICNAAPQVHSAVGLFR